MEKSDMDFLNANLEDERKLIEEIDALCAGLMELDAGSIFSANDVQAEMKKLEGYLRQPGY